MITNTDSYFDFASLAALKNKDAAGQSESSKAVLEKFEALFIDQMLQSMRKATVKSELFDSEGIKLYESLFDKEISEELAKGGGLGMKNSLELHLGLESSTDNASGETRSYLPTEKPFHSLEINRPKALSLYSKQAIDI
jgi:flagellar protein FlgJ